MRAAARGALLLILADASIGKPSLHEVMAETLSVREYVPAREAPPLRIRAMQRTHSTFQGRAVLSEEKEIFSPLCGNRHRCATVWNAMSFLLGDIAHLEEQEFPAEGGLFLLVPSRRIFGGWRHNGRSYDYSNAGEKLFLATGADGRHFIPACEISNPNHTTTLRYVLFETPASTPAP